MSLALCRFIGEKSFASRNSNYSWWVHENLNTEIAFIFCFSCASGMNFGTQTAGSFEMKSSWNPHEWLATEKNTRISWLWSKSQKAKGKIISGLFYRTAFVCLTESRNCSQTFTPQTKRSNDTWAIWSNVSVQRLRNPSDFRFQE